MGNEELSSAIGWISIACWIVVYSPQIVENYKLKSGEGLSVPFVVIWLLGDLCNLIGLTVPRQTTVIILAIYVFYYRRIHPVRLARSDATPGVIVSNEAGEASATTSRARGRDRRNKEGARIRQGGATLYRCACTAAWLMSKHGETNDSPRRPKDVIEWKSQVIGWTSAALYLGSRIPQILKNFKTKCEGLALALFMFSIAGNVTYAFSICTESMDRQHLIANASWLAGSGLTVFLDVFVLCQFFYFRSAEGRFISETSLCTEES
ncbi:PQ-loop-domain-containing protein [Phellopilus nigrolimitatus]|nr:PQ-loop-domain-containing protein [Phellopilus nigrolimitatus]